jgi:hypothetical protein
VLFKPSARHRNRLISFPLTASHRCNGVLKWGGNEDLFFATIFLGSGLLYIAMIFTSAALAGGLIRVLSNAPKLLVQTGTYALGRAQIYQTMNVHGIKMAGVFMFSTSTH